MKFSNYNIFSKKSNLVFNTLTRAMAVLSDSDYRVFTSLESDVKELNEELINDFYQNGFLIDDNRNEEAEIKHLYWNTKFSSKTFHITIMTTLECNFRCIYCFEKHQNISMSSETIEKIKKMVLIELERGYSNLSVDWYGGEPLMNMNCIVELSNFFITLCKEKGIEYSASITTNGYDFTPNIQQKLCSLGVKHAQITLDGSKDIHDKRRMLVNGESSFDRIKENIVNAIDKMTISIRINVDNDNKDDLLHFIDSFDILHSDLVGIYACIVTPALDSDYVVNNHEELMRAIVEMYFYALRKGFCVNSASNLLFDNYRTCVVDSNNQFIIEPTGKLFKCGESYDQEDPGLVGKILEDGGQEISISKLSKWTKDPFEFEECRECPYLPICMGGCVMKRITRKGNYCMWELKKHHEDFLELLYEMLCMYNGEKINENVKI